MELLLITAKKLSDFIHFNLLLGVRGCHFSRYDLYLDESYESYCKYIFVVNNFKILLYYTVRVRLCNSNPVKFCQWCPVSNILCLLLQTVGDADWGKEKQVFCAVLLHKTQIYQRCHWNHEIFIGDSDCWPPKPPAKFLSTWHRVSGVAASRT